MNPAEKSTFVCGAVCLCFPWSVGRWEHGMVAPGHGFCWPCPHEAAGGLSDGLSLIFTLEFAVKINPS